jgi:hypothetical protein
MQKLLLANYILNLRPLYGPFHRDMVNVGWLVESLRSSLKTGSLVVQRLGEPEFLPVLEGILKGDISQDFELISFYPTTENFLIHSFGLYEKYKLPLHSERPLWINLESINFNTREFFKKLIDFETTGYAIVENRVKLLKAYLLLQRGYVLKAQYGEEKDQTALKRLLEDLSQEVCTLRVYELPEEIVSFFALEPELAGVYQSFESVPIKSLPKTSMVVSVSPERYGYRVYVEGEEVFSEGFEEEAPFFELFILSKDLSPIEPIDVFSMIEEKATLKVVKYDPNHPVLYFCPACWSVISREDMVCPNCGYDLKEFHNLPYEYKLIMALEHPVKEMKRNVIYTIGKKDLEMAIPHLEVMINKETDPIILMEIADALSRMTSPQAIGLLRVLSQHQYPVVRSRAMLHLQKRLRSLDV